MEKAWTKIVSMIYYTGVGITMLVTGIRFLYRSLRNQEKRNDFLEQIEKTHLPLIYEALQKITNKLDIDLNFTPGSKPLDEE